MHLVLDCGGKHHRPDFLDCHPPNVLTDYLNDLSSEFSKFYENCPVLKADGKKIGLRFELTRAFKETSATMLGLLGIEALSRM